MIQINDIFVNFLDERYQITKISPTGLVIYAKNLADNITYKFTFYQASGLYIRYKTANVDLGMKI